MQISSVNNINFGLGYDNSVGPYLAKGFQNAVDFGELDTWKRSKELLDKILPNDMYLTAFQKGVSQKLMIKLPDEKYWDMNADIDAKRGSINIAVIDNLILKIIDFKKHYNFEYPAKKKSDVLKDRETEITAWHRNREINREKFANIRLANSLKIK